MDFNPRLREGGDADNSKRLHPLKISIHASAKEATLCRILIAHAILNFNPRLREGGDNLKEALVLFDRISIHASAKEATTRQYHIICRLEFQSTPPRRRRLKTGKNKQNNYIFQSTPPRRRRQQNV